MAINDGPQNFDRVLVLFGGGNLVCHRFKVPILMAGDEIGSQKRIRSRTHHKCNLDLTFQDVCNDATIEIFTRLQNPLEELLPIITSETTVFHVSPFRLKAEKLLAAGQLTVPLRRPDRTTKKIV